MTELLVAVYGLAWVPGWVWLLLVWFVAAWVVSVLVGRMIRDRDRRG